MIEKRFLIARGLVEHLTGLERLTEQRSAFRVVELLDADNGLDQEEKLLEPPRAKEQARTTRNRGRDLAQQRMAEGKPLAIRC